MNWKEELIRLYDVNADKAGEIEYKIEKKQNKGVIEENKIPYTLLPLYHSNVMAQIEVTIYEDGSFMNAAVVDGNDRFTVIPVTEKSSNRTSGNGPHPLCDNLFYIAGDYKKYADDNTKYFNDYISQLKLWVNSNYSHTKIKAIYEYLIKETLIQDLLRLKILELDNNGKLKKKEKIFPIDTKKIIVRFIVRCKNFYNDDYIPDECWLDRTLQERYIEYVRSLQKQSSLCYINGNIEPTVENNPKGIRNDGDRSKLISSKEGNFTFKFKGRFADKNEALLIGYESSQKMHNALKWIIRKQGTYFDSLTLVAWESALKTMPDWDKDTYTIAESYDEYDDSEEEYYSNDIIAQKFNNALLGYGKSISDNSNMTLLGIDAATTGRLALVEEKSLDSAKYLENIKKWHETCEWRHEIFKEGKLKVFYGMIGVKDIADILFGKSDRKRLVLSDEKDKKLYSKVAQKLIPCIWEGQRIPYDYVERAVLRASQPLSYKEKKNWERTLALACSFVKRYRYDRYKEKWTMSNDEICTKRDYLYGCLLAVADYIEYSTYDFNKDKNRVTNAMKYMNRFSQRPFDTWQIIEESLNPYLNKKKLSTRLRYHDIINKIIKNFKEEDFCDNSKLNGLYLLGYHRQSYKLRNYKKENNINKEAEE